MREKKNLVTLVFLIVWLSSLLISIGLVYGMTAMRIVDDDGGNPVPDPVYVDVNDLGSLTVMYSTDGNSYETVSSEQEAVVNKDTSQSVYFKVQWRTATVSPVPYCILMGGEIPTVLASLTHVEYKNEVHTYSCTYSIVHYGENSITPMFFRFSGGSIWAVFYRGDTIGFYLRVSNTVIPPDPYTDPPPISQPPDTQFVVAQMGMVVVVVMAHMVVLPVGVYIIRRVVR